MGFALSDMQLSTPSFENGAEMPARHTGEGEDLSPALFSPGSPGNVETYAVIRHDPDAPLVKPGSYGFVHWALYGIPGSVTELPESSTLPQPHQRDS